VNALLEALAAELERPRQLSAKVLNYISGTYSLDREAIGGFLTGQMSGLEDYEIDLILSPVFTPKLADQAVFAGLLGGRSIERNEWPAIIEQLVDRPTQAQLVTQDGQTHRVSLRAVTIERYVNRLRLDGFIPEGLLQLIDGDPSESDRPTLKAIARRAVWDNDERRDILARYLRNAHHVPDAIGLLNLMESYHPANLSDLLQKIPKWQDELRHEINVTGGSKPFFNARIEHEHGGGRDQRQQDQARVSAKQAELEFLERLKKALA
jgi:hypothetical protein